MPRLTRRQFLLSGVALAALGSVRRAPAAEGTPVARTIVAVTDWKAQKVDFRLTALVRMGLLPLNHLGLRPSLHDVTDLPDLDTIADIAGVVIWLEVVTASDPATVYPWLARARDRGVPVLVLGDLPDPAGAVDQGMVADTLARIGFVNDGQWSSVTFDTKVIKADKTMVGFEAALTPPIPPFNLIRPTAGTDSFLVVRRGDGGESHLVLAGPGGGFVAPGYVFFTDGMGGTRWYINPFALFARVFALAGQPRPDPTTLAGRRVYYSHIDGDGWRNRTDIAEYEGRPAMAADVIYERVIRPTPDLPVSVAPIAADLDPAWVGDDRAQAICRELFALAQVEPASHTFSHPFDWHFFADYTPAKEKPFEKIYAAQEAGHYVQQVDADGGYTAPRAYGNQPFSLARNIGGAAKYISRFAPADKPVKLLQWSGDCLPFPAAMDQCVADGLANINGGDSRFDREFPSYSTVAPFGVPLGDGWQIYASNSNENTYTDDWTDRFFGFRDLVETWKNTESPRRVQAMNLYYHMYSGTRTASLKALLDNLAFAGKQPIHPVATDHYSDMVRGFFTATLHREGAGWRIRDRGRLQTLRFDDGGHVDWTASQGVIGSVRTNGSLYVALDAAADAPLVVLATAETPAPWPVLESGRWQVWRVDPGGYTARARGHGPGDLVWRVPRGGAWRLTATAADGTTHTDATDAADGLAAFTLPAIALAAPVTLHLAPA